MKILKNPMANAFYFALTTVICASVLIASSKLIGNSPFSNSNTAWSSFIYKGNLKYVGCAMIAIAIVIDLLSALRQKSFDEYQTSILEKSLLINGIFTAILLPISAFSLVCFPQYAVGLIFSLVVLQWVITMITECIYLIKNY